MQNVEDLPVWARILVGIPADENHVKQAPQSDDAPAPIADGGLPWQHDLTLRYRTSAQLGCRLGLNCEATR